MTNTQRADLMVHTGKALDYWTGRKDRCREGQEQYEYHTKMMKFLVTQMDTYKTPIRPQGTSLVFPSL